MNRPKDDEEAWEQVQEFSRRFAMLVREFMPEYPHDDQGCLMLMQMQEHTSCYSPYVWSDQFRPHLKGASA